MEKKVKLEKLLQYFHGRQMFIVHEDLLAAKVIPATEAEHLELIEILLHHKLIRRMYSRSDQNVEKMDVVTYQISPNGSKYLENPNYEKLFADWERRELSHNNPILTPLSTDPDTPSDEPAVSPGTSTQNSVPAKPMNIKLIAGIIIVVIVGIVIWYFATH